MSPRCWSPLPLAYPLALTRVVILDADELRDRWVDHLLMARYEPELGADKVGLILGVKEHLARHYRRPAERDQWAQLAIRRELLGSTGIGSGVAILDHRIPTAVAVDDPPVDWWLFLLPDGSDWQAIDGEPVHAMIEAVHASPDEPGHRLRTLEMISRCFREWSAADWQALAGLEQADAMCRFNDLYAALVEMRARSPHA